MPTILTKKSDTPGSIPATANLTNAAGGAELAVNTADKRLFTINSTSQVVELGTNPSSITCADGSFTVARIGSGTVTQLTSTSATITTLTATSATVTNLTATSLVISNLSVASMNITTLTSASATITNLVNTSASITTLTNNPTFGAGTANGVLYLNGSKVATSGSALYFDGANLGVGTTSPGNRLHVVGGRIQSTVAATGASFYQATNSSGSTIFGNDGVGGYILTDWAAPLLFYINNAEQMRLTSTGLGIGTSSPAQKLHVASAGNNYIVSSNTSGSTSALLLGSESGQNTIYSWTTVAGSTGRPLAFYTGASEAMRLDTSGNLGIGTSSPAGKLDVVGSNSRVRWDLSNSYVYQAATNTAASAFASAYYDGSSHQWLIASAARMVLDTSGNLGIGTSSPTEKLDVSGNAAVTGTGYLALQRPLIPPGENGIPPINFRMYSTGTTYEIGASIAAGSEAGWTSTSTPARLMFSTTPSGSTTPVERLRITATGRLFVGSTTAPSGDSVKLSLVGGSSTTQPSALQLTFNGGTYGGALIGAVEQGGGIQFYTFTGNVGSESYAERARITSGGDLLVGRTATSANERLGVTTSEALVIDMNSTAANGGYMRYSASGVVYGYIGTATGIIGSGGTDALALRSETSLIFATNTANERARITSGGAFLVGTTALNTAGTGSIISAFIGATNNTSGAACFQAWNQATTGDNLFVDFYTEGGSGTQRGTIDYNRAGGQVRYNTTSDYRAKEVYGPVDDSGEQIDALKVYRGKMLGATQERPMMIAHEAQEVVPYAVGGEKDAVNEDGTPKYQTMDHQILVPLLIAELQSLRKRVAELEAK